MDTQQKLEKIKAKCEEVIKQNQTSGFIPTKDCVAEAMARSTIAAIDGLLTEPDERAGYTIGDILTAWPDELL